MIDETKYQDKIAFFRIQIGNMPSRTGEAIRNLIKESPFDDIKNDPNLVEGMARYFESIYDVQQQVGAIIRETTYRPWLNDLYVDKNFSPYYWTRYKEYLLEEVGLPPDVVSTLDSDTHGILDHSGNPNEEESWKKRGMVLGHVQSGKTTNYSALICKAADAGYKVVILLSGISNLLRSQTQQRIDESVVGKQSLLGNSPFRLLGVGKRPIVGQSRRFPLVGTSVRNDFNKREAQVYSGVMIGSVTEPIIFVVKKNFNVLQNLFEWLQTVSPDGRRIFHPLLLIDDEADNASINTHQDPNMVTRINGAIRGILRLFERSSYVGYTATPFANIFIEPDSIEDMVEHDLFPSDFIKSLEPPSNYIGPDQVFLGGLHSDTVRVFDDYDDFIPFRHNSSHRVEGLSESLCRAVRLFVLCRAIMVSEGFDKRHATMMVNVSPLNAIQEQVSGLIYLYLENVKNAIRLNANSDQGDTNTHIAELKRTFEEEYGKTRKWEDIRSHLNVSASTIVIRTVNGSKKEILDYENNRENGLHVIAIGGFALSRGLTLEGLCVSYVIRNAGTYDTLMQMGRWFGYRDQYDDICRIFLPRQMCERYEFVSDAMRELRNEISEMNSMNKTPREFGLRVRKHTATIFQITARNKMRGVQFVKFAASDYSCRHLETRYIFADNKINGGNYEYVNRLQGALGEQTRLENNKHSHHSFWRGVDVEVVLGILRNVKMPDTNPWLGQIAAQEGMGLGDYRTLVHQYIMERRHELARWDVCIPHNNSSKELRDRLKGRHNGSIYEVGYSQSGGRRVSDRQDAGIGLSDEVWKRAMEETGKTKGKLADKDFNERRAFPLLLLHVFNARKEGSEAPFFDCSAVAYSICFPPTSIEAQEKDYAANIVYQQQMFNFNIDEEEDDRED